jgi:hypothetical protein
MSSSRAITLTYALADPPLKSEKPAVPAAQTLSFPITPSSTSTYAPIYSATSAAVLQAQKELNESLTAWKDAIGDAEKVKEDTGKVEYGKGKAARMMQYAAGRDREADAEVEEDEDEDDPGDAE